MKRTPVESSNIASVGYDYLDRTLEIEFKNGSVYEYLHVPESKYEGLIAAQSVGQFFNENVKYLPSKQTTKPRPKYIIDGDTGHAHQDSGQFRSYNLVAEGNNRDELIADAHIFEVDQDGETINDYPLEQASNGLETDALKLIDSVLAPKKQGAK